MQEIARALVPAGGQFARIFVPLIQNAQQLDKALGVTSAQDARGASARELAKALRQPNEQLAALVTNLERVGAKLAQAGALDPFVALVGVDSTTCSTRSFGSSTSLDDLQNLLPAPFNSALVPALELYGVLRLMRRFDVGGSLPAGGSAAYQAFRGSLARPEQAAGRSQVLQGLGEERKFLEDQRQNTAKSAALSAYQADRARERVVELQRINASDDEVVRAQKQFESRLDESRRLAPTRPTCARASSPTSSRPTASRRSRAAATRTSAPRRATPASTTTARRARVRPSSARCRWPAASTGPGASRRRAPRRSSLGPATSDDVLAGTRYTAQGGAVTGQLAGARLAIRNRMEAFRAQNTALQTAAREGGIAARTGAGLLAASATGIGAAAKGIGAMGAGLRAFGAAALSALGPLDVALIGVGDARRDDQRRRRRRSTRTTGKSTDCSPTKAASRASGRGRCTSSTRTRSWTACAAAFAHVANFFLPGHPALDVNAQEDEIAAKRLQEMQSLERAQGKGALKYLPQIRASLTRRLAGAQDVGEQEKAIDQAVTELQHGWAVTFGDKAARQKAAEFRSELEGQIADLRAAQGDIQAAVLRIRDLPGATAFVTAQQQRTQLEGYNPTQTPTAVGAGIARFRELIAEQPDKAGAYLQQIQALQGVMKQADERFQRLLASAKGVEARGAVREDYVDQYRTQLQTEQLEQLRLYVRTPRVTVTAAQAQEQPATVGAARQADRRRQPPEAARPADQARLRRPGRDRARAGPRAGAGGDLDLRRAHAGARGGALHQARRPTRAAGPRPRRAREDRRHLRQGLHRVRQRRGEGPPGPRRRLRRAYLAPAVRR